jgi:hypothetical protein
VSFDRRLLATLLLAACQGSGVHGLEVGAEPLLVIHGHVDLGTLPRVHKEAPLLGALIWAAVPTVSSICLTFSEPKIRPGCSDPYGVFLGEIEQAAPVSEAGDFELPLVHLPRASVSVGDDVTRVAYGTLVVAEDLDRNGQISFPDSDFAMVPEQSQTDLLLAATFWDLHAPQQRLIFREGGFIADSTFYPAPGCGTPPPGFSLGVFPPYASEPATPGSCSSLDAGQVITVGALPTADAAALECRTAQRREFLHEVRTDRPPQRDTVCLSPTIMANIPQGRCPRLSVFLLAGCSEDPFCEKPEFDHRANPPGWWPCH